MKRVPDITSIREEDLDLFDEWLMINNIYKINMPFLISDIMDVIKLNNIIIGYCTTNNYNIYTSKIEYILNNYKYLPNNWWDCILIKNNVPVGHGIIKIDKTYLEEKNIEINFNLDHLIKNN